MSMERPPVEYGEWTRGNAGQVGRTVTRWYWCEWANVFMPVVDWEPHPDEVSRKFALTVPEARRMFTP